MGAASVLRRGLFGPSTELRIVAEHLRRDRPALFGLGIVTALLAIAVLADVVSPYDPISQNLPDRFAPPSATHLFGTDQFGRDVLSRVIHGSRISLQVGLVVIAISLSVGTLLGAVAGFFAGRADMVVMRIADTFLAFPGLILAIGITAVLGQSIFNVMIALAVVSWPGYARVVRGQVLTVRSLEYVDASRAMGASSVSILFGHVLPNSFAPILVLATIGMGWAILAEAGLSFLGLGVRPPTPSWGDLISTGRGFLLQAPHIATIPGIILGVTVLAFNLLGDGLRDALDPRLRL